MALSAGPEITDQIWTKKPGVGMRYSDVMHAFQFSAISESNSCWQRFSIPTSTLTSLAPEGNLKRLGACCGWCPNTVCLQECPMHSHFDGPQVLPTAILPPCLKSLPVCLLLVLLCRAAVQVKSCKADPCTQLDANVRPHNSTAHIFQVH